MVKKSQNFLKLQNQQQHQQKHWNTLKNYKNINNNNNQNNNINNNKKKGNLTKFNTIDATIYLYNCYWALGIYMPKTHKICYVFYSIFLNGAVTLFLPIAFTISYLTISGDELDIGYLLTSLQVAIDVYGCSTKIVVMAFMLRKLRAVDDILKYLDGRCQDADEISEQENIIKFGRKFVVFLSVVYLSYSVSTFLGSIAMGRAPYSIYLMGLDWRRSPLEFYVASFIEFLFMDVAVLQQIADDSYPVIYVCILRAHLNILLMRINKLAKNPLKSKEQNVQELKMCIKDHKSLIELYGIIAPVISITLFIQFTVTSSILGTTLINMLLFATDLSSRIGSFFYLCAVTMEIFPLCYYAQCLMSDSDRLSAVIFHSNWSGQNAYFQKLLIFFIHRTQQTIVFTAGKLFPINLNSFLGIAKFSFSLYTLIEGMDIKDKEE